MSFDISLVNNYEELEVEGQAAGGSFKVDPPEEGVALFRLVSVIEFGKVMGEFNGKPKETRPVMLEFELVHPRHAIKKEDGEFIRNHTVSVRLNKSNNERAKYLKLFNKLNYDGSVPTPPGKIASFAPFLGKAFFGSITNNVSEKTGKTYTNIDKDGEYTIGAPRVPEIDETLGTPTGNFKPIPVPEGSADIRCFLWETGVSDDTYRAMWDSIAVTGEKKDGTPRNNWAQNAISDSEENIEWVGSRAQSLFDVETAALDAAVTEAAADPLADLLTPEAAAASAPVATASVEEPAPVVEAAPAEPVDPLAELGL